MQTFLTSHTQSSLHTSFHKKGQGSGFTKPLLSAGFTLIELLICCAIIGVITAIVLLKYGSFDSTTLLKGAAYEIALGLREAQVKSVSVVRNNDNNFDNPYGISFTPFILGVNTIEDSKKYQTFFYKDQDVDPDVRQNPKYGDAKSANVGSPNTLDRGMYIKKICVTGKDSDNDTCAITRLDVSFRRPEFNALFNAEGYGASMDEISTGEITISSTNNPDSGFVIVVTKLGQISINSL